jgi:hypothetical protein
MSASRKSSPVFIESLENRQLMSTTLLSPSAVEGNYVGTASYGSTVEVKLAITSTTETLTVVGIGTIRTSISSKAFKKLREGHFSFDGSYAGKETLVLTGTVTSKGAKISGNFVASGKEALSGTFVVKKKA